VGRSFRNANRDVHVLGPSISLARNWPRRSQRSETAIRGTTTWRGYSWPQSPSSIDRPFSRATRVVNVRASVSSRSKKASNLGNSDARAGSDKLLDRCFQRRDHWIDPAKARW